MHQAQIISTVLLRSLNHLNHWTNKKLMSLEISPGCFCREVAGLFFDLTKAYGTIWQYGIIRDLHRISLRGRLPVFVSEYPRDRRIRVRIGNIIGHTKATKSHIMSRWSMIVCHHCGQTLTIDHMLLLCPVLQECREEYYSADTLSTLFKTNPETRILEFLR